jgi:hypothetical protein
MATQTLALYELEPIGVGGALEAVATHWFCSETCRSSFTCDGPTANGTNNEWMDGTVCDSCGVPLVRATD